MATEISHNLLHIKALEEILQELFQKCHALTTLVVDKEGTSLIQVGNTEYFDIDPLGTRLAALFEAGLEISQMLGKEHPSLILQQSGRRHLLVCVVNDFWLVTVIFEDEQRLGLIRHELKRGAEKLASLLPPGPPPDSIETSRFSRKALPIGKPGKSILDLVFEMETKETV